MNVAISERDDGGFNRSWAEMTPVDRRSVILFRLGEACNNHCPFCSNSGDPKLHLIAGDELLRRVDYLAASGVRRVVITGGEPTIHPAFDAVIERLNARAIRWDINTHGRTFAASVQARRAAKLGLRRAIVSLHHHEEAVSAQLFGSQRRAHAETVEGIAALMRAGVKVMINCVLTRANAGDLEQFVEFCVARFAEIDRFAVKFAFPTTTGKGGGWAGIQLRYDEIRASLARLVRRRNQWPVPLYFENIPNCVLQVPGAEPMSRSGFGQTHYLDDLGGREFFDMRGIESGFAAFGPDCRLCQELPHCSGVSRMYAASHGYNELTPLLPTPDKEPLS